VNSDELQLFHEQGFLLARNVLPREEALAIRPLLQKAIDEDIARWGDNPNYLDKWMVHNLMTRGEAFLKLLELDRMHQYLSAVLDDRCILYAYTSSSMPPRGANYSRRVHVDCPRLIPGYITNVGWLLALDDFTDENGATYALPGSHRSVAQPSDDEFFSHAVRWYPSAGDAILFNARVFHSGGENKTNVARHAITMNVCRSYMRQRFDYPRAVPPELVQRLGEVGRRFLGFNVRVPSSLDEYYVPAADRLYLPGQG